MSRSTIEGAASACRGMDRKQRGPVMLFCAVSIALHALALAVNPPAGAGLGRGFVGVPTAFQTVLSPLDPAFELPPEDSGGALSTEAAPPSPAAPGRQQTRQEGRSESMPGMALASFPIPERWFSADELTVRAEPLTNVTIDYPAELSDRRVAGRVSLLLHIDEQGFVRRTEIEESIPEGVFDRAALAAWAEVRFAPAMKDGTAVKSRKLLEISFLP